MSRGLVGDLRDILPDSKINKNTIPVILGSTFTRIFTAFLLSQALVILFVIYHNLFFIFYFFPMILAILFYKNGYILHQLTIVFTSFLFSSIMFLFINDYIFLLVMLFLSVFFNFIFYPLLPRKSNPVFSNS